MCKFNLRQHYISVLLLTLLFACSRVLLTLHIVRFKGIKTSKYDCKRIFKKINKNSTNIFHVCSSTYRQAQRPSVGDFTVFSLAKDTDEKEE